MFTLKKLQKQGICSAMRCKSPAPDLLCERHELEWREAGCPQLSGEPTAVIGTLTPPDLKIRLDVERDKAARALAMLAHLPNDTPYALDKLGMLVNTSKGMIDRLEEERKTQVQPLNDAVKTINGWFKPVTDFYTAAQKLLKQKISDAVTAQEKAREEALKTISDGAGEAPADAFALAHAPIAAPSNVQLRDVTKYVVNDKSVIPERYWVRELNMKLIEADMKAGVDVPGVARVVEKQVAAKG